MNKELTITAKKLVEQLIAECKDCGGKGHIGDGNGRGCEVDCSTCQFTNVCVTCPTCADLRALREELVTGDNGDCSCGPNICDNCLEPEWDIQSLRKLLERMGEWEGFIKWHEMEAYGFEGCSVPYEIDPIINWTLGAYASADILTSGPLMAQAVNEYFEWGLK